MSHSQIIKELPAKGQRSPKSRMLVCHIDVKWRAVSPNLRVV